MRTLNVRALLCAALAAVACASILPLFSPSPIQASGGTTQPYGGCAAPSTQGFNFCNPGEPNSFAWTTSSPVQLIVAATSGAAQVQSMEVLVDGKKVAQEDGTPFDEPILLSAGTHKLTVIEHDAIGGELKADSFDLDSVGDDHATCDAPSKPGVNICAPFPGGCNSESWVDFDAVGKGKSGSVNHMELWIAGTKIANFPGDRIRTSLIMAFGEIKVVEVDSKGNSLSASQSFFGPC